MFSLQEMAQIIILVSSLFKLTYSWRKRALARLLLSSMATTHAPQAQLSTSLPCKG